MMSTATISLISSVITGLLSLIGVIYTSRKQHDITMSEVKTEIALVKKDITNLDESVKKHNSVIERMYKVENSIDLLEEKVKVANHRLDDLEKEE